MEQSLNKTAFSATLHCLTGCAIGEVIGMVISTALGWATWPSVIFSITLAFIFGYSFSLLPLFRHGLGWRKALGLALAADTVSITVMEITDNGFILLVPNAINAGLGSLLFWISLTASLMVAFAAALPVNRWLINRGKGHAVMHDYH
jgi:hypothetical protein